MTKQRVLILTGGDWHDYAAGAKIMSEALTQAGMEVTATQDSSAVKSLANFSAVVLYTQGDKFKDDEVAALTQYVRNGGGLVGVHSASDTNQKSEAYGKLIGSRFIGHGPVFNFSVVVSDEKHPVAHRVKSFRITDELYILKPESDFHVFLEAWWDGKKQPMAYSRAEGKGKVVYLANGHWAESLADPAWQQILARSVRYAAGEDWSAKTVKVAAIGYGGAFNMGKMHLDSCKTAGLTPVAVCDVDPKRVATAKTELGEHIQTYTKVEDLLSKSDAEMCIVITPHNTHAPLSIQCLEAGRHVVTEKPYTITTDEATRVIETAKQKKLMATVFHNRRWDAHFVTLKRIIEAGTIGEVFFVECQFGGYGEQKTDWWRSYKDVSGGFIYDWGAHITDWTLGIMPYKIESVSGFFAKKMWHQVSNEDHTLAMIQFEGGRRAHIELSSLASVGKSPMRILGTKGGIEIDNLWDKNPGLKLVTFGPQGQRQEQRVPYDDGDWHSFYRNVADHLLLGEALAVTPESARKVIAVLSLSEESSKKGGAPVAMPFEQ